MRYGDHRSDDPYARAPQPEDYFIPASDAVPKHDTLEDHALPRSNRILSVRVEKGEPSNRRHETRRLLLIGWLMTALAPTMIGALPGLVYIYQPLPAARFFQMVFADHVPLIPAIVIWFGLSTDHLHFFAACFFGLFAGIFTAHCGGYFSATPNLTVARYRRTRRCIWFAVPLAALLAFFAAGLALRLPNPHAQLYSQPLVYVAGLLFLLWPGKATVTWFTYGGEDILLTRRGLPERRPAGVYKGVLSLNRRLGLAWLVAIVFSLLLVPAFELFGVFVGGTVDAAEGIQNGFRLQSEPAKFHASFAWIVSAGVCGFFGLVALPSFLPLLVVRAAATTFPPPWFFDRLPARIVEWFGFERPNHWETQIARLAASKGTSGHLYLGVHAREGVPLFLPREMLKHHTHILGGPGTGKTSLGLIPILTQLIRQADCPVVIIDLKGDEALFNTTRIEAERSGSDRFRWFTNIYGRSTYIFDPLAGLNRPDLSINQVVETIMHSLNLEHGVEYGAGFYGRTVRSAFTRILETNPNIQTFAELEELIPLVIHDRKLLQDVGELTAIIETLARIRGINISERGTRPTPADERVHRAGIRMADVVENNRVVYFFLDASRETAAVREIALLATRQLLTAMKEHSNGNQGFLIIDEFQRMVVQNFDVLIELARGANLGIFLCHQALTQLKTGRSTDLSEVIEESTAFKLQFGVRSKAELERVSGVSGQTVYREGIPTDDPVEPIDFLTSTGPRITVNDLIRYTNDPTISVASLPSSKLWQWGGFPLPVRHLRTVPPEEFERRNSFDPEKGIPWPAPTPDTLVPTRETSGGAKSTGDRKKGGKQNGGKRRKQGRAQRQDPQPRPEAEPQPSAKASDHMADSERILREKEQEQKRQKRKRANQRPPKSQRKPKPEPPS